MINYILGIIILILAYPIGKFLIKNTREEIKENKKFFLFFIYLFSILILTTFFTKYSLLAKLSLIFSYIFMLIIFLMYWFEAKSEI